MSRPLYAALLADRVPQGFDRGVWPKLRQDRSQVLAKSLALHRLWLLRGQPSFHRGRGQQGRRLSSRRRCLLGENLVGNELDHVIEALDGLGVVAGVCAQVCEHTAKRVASVEEPLVRAKSPLNSRQTRLAKIRERSVPAVRLASKWYF